MGRRIVTLAVSSLVTCSIALTGSNDANAATTKPIGKGRMCQQGDIVREYRLTTSPRTYLFDRFVPYPVAWVGAGTLVTDLMLAFPFTDPKTVAYASLNFKDPVSGRPLMLMFPAKGNGKPQLTKQFACPPNGIVSLTTVNVLPRRTPHPFYWGPKTDLSQAVFHLTPLR